MAVIDPSAVWDFAREVVGGARRDRGRTLATVTRVDPDGTTWVTTGDGGEAPATSVAAGVSVGDTVTLEWDGSAMGIRSNVSDPAPPGSSIRRAVDRARGVASAAQKVADAVNQHFFADGNGIHVTEATQDEWDASHAGANVLINSIGQLFRDGLNNLLTLTTENGARALTVWDGLGNTADHIRAIIGETIQLGNADSGNYMTLDDTGVEIYNESKTDGYSAKIGATFASFLGGMLGFGSTVEGRICISEMTHQPPNLYGAGGLLRFTTTNTGRSTEETSAELLSDEFIVDGTLDVNALTGNVKSAFVVSTVQLLEGTVSIAAGGSTSTLTASESRSGWYPLGIVGWASNYADVVLARCRLAGATDGLTSVEYVAKNTGSSAHSPNINVRVLWVKVA